MLGSQTKLHKQKFLYSLKRRPWRDFNYLYFWWGLYILIHAIKLNKELKSKENSYYFVGNSLLQTELVYFVNFLQQGGPKF